MITSRLPLRRVVVWALVIALLATMGLAAAAGTADAATKYKLTASGAGIVTTGTAHQLAVSFTKNGKPVKSAKAKLQYKKGSKWVTVKTVKIKNGEATASVKSAKALNRTYRFYVKGKGKSASQVVRFVPASFDIAGSGFGHGVGMAQYGAYRLAQEGRTATDILSYYYPGAKPGTAANNSRTIKVQILGPGGDTQTSTAIALRAGAFTIANESSGDSQETSARARVDITVRDGLVTARFESASGELASVTAAVLRLSWDNQSIATVGGAQGTYRYGSLLITAIGDQPNVVNELAMNTEYLYGIAEMASDWGRTAHGMEALKAQAIAARTYVIGQALKANTKPGGVFAECNCQVYDDTRSQNFLGATKSEGAANQPWVNAVNATIVDGGAKVQVVWSPNAGELAEAPYFSASGEYKIGKTTYRGTAANQDVFGKGVPTLSYLTHVDDPYSAQVAPADIKAWKKSISQAKAEQVFGVSGITKIVVTARYSSGQAMTLTATTATGRTVPVTKSAETWRTTLGLKGAWITSIDPT